MLRPNKKKEEKKKGKECPVTEGHVVHVLPTPPVPRTKRLFVLCALGAITPALWSPPETTMEAK